MAAETHFVPDDGLFYGREILERRQQDMAPRRATDILDEATELIAQGDEDLILILDRLCGALVSWNRTAADGVKAGGSMGALRLPSRKGISSSRVRSGPRARAIVERRWMALRRSRTSSCWTRRWSTTAVRRPGSAWTGLGFVTAHSAAYLQLVDENGDGVELVVHVRRVSLGEADPVGDCLRRPGLDG